MASLNVVAGPTGPVPDLSNPQPDSALGDLSEAYAYLQSCRERESRAKSILVMLIRDARTDGARLVDIAEQLGCTRQYVQKIIREAELGEELERKAGLALERAAEAEMQKNLRGLTFSTRDRQCPTCKRLKSRPSDPCNFCGNDPVGNIALGGSEWNRERMEYDAAFGGGIR